MARSPAPGTTRANLVFQQLQADVLNGRLAPGSRLGLAEMGSRYGVSNGVLREVFPRLVERGLATSEPQLGFRVRELSVDDLVQLTEARVAYETVAVRASVARGGVAWEVELVARHHALVRASDPPTSPGQVPGDVMEAWIGAHAAFHHALLQGCGNDYMIETCARLRSISEVYRWWSHKRRHVAGEHSALLEAALAHDIDAAARLLERHIRLTSENMIADNAAAPPAERASPPRPPAGDFS